MAKSPKSTSRKTTTRTPARRKAERAAVTRTTQSVIRAAKAGVRVKPIAGLPNAPVDDTLAANDFAEKIVLLKWSRTRFSNKVRVTDESKMNTTAAKRMVTMHKRLLRSPAYGRILTCDTYITDYLLEHGMQTSIFGRSGLYAIAIPMVNTVHAELVSRKAQREALVNEFVSSYAEDIAATRDELGDLFNPDDYPTPEAVRDSFTCGWQFIDIGTPSKLQGRVSNAIFDEERRKAEATFGRIAEEVRDVLRVGMAKLVEGMVDRLSPTESGAKKAIHESFVEKFKGFLDIFDQRNVTDDRELSKLVAQARVLLDGGDVEALRGDESYRERTLQAFEGINATLQEFITNKPKRMISFNDEEGVA